MACEPKKRSPHLEIELDALEHAADVARAAGISEDTAIAGLVRMWRHCWRERVLSVSALAVRGFFGHDATEALQTFGFLGCPIDGLHTVRGAPRMLRIEEAKQEARSRGGHASKHNLVPGPKAKGQPKASRRPAEGLGEEQPKESFAWPSPLQPPSTSYQQPTKEEETRPRNILAGSWVQEVWQHHRDTFGGKGSFVPAQDRDLIQARLADGRSAEELMQAVDGFKANAWRVQRGLTKLSQILESDETVRIAIGWKHHPPDQETARPGKGRASEADRDWTRPVAVDADGQVVL